MKLVHLTDIHLDCVRGDRAAAARAALREHADAEQIVITGDIATAPTLAPHLTEFARGCGDRPLFFVLGNHDAWGGSIVGSRRVAADLGQFEPGLVYLPAAGVVRLTERTALVGVDGWYDGRAGKGLDSSVRLNDWTQIAEFRSLLGPRARLVEMQRIAGRDAMICRERIEDAIAAGFRHIVVATHIPPIREACVDPEGRSSDRDHLPWYTNVVLGHTLVGLAQAHPGVALLVLAGHCHGPADVPFLPNLRLVTGRALYGAPSVAGVHEIP